MHRLTASALLLALTTLCGVAHAQEPEHTSAPVYAGIGGSELSPGNESAVKVFAGWQFTPTFAAEVNYNGVQSHQASVDTEAVDLSGVAYTPECWRVKGFATLGLAHTRTSVDGIGHNWQNSGTGGVGLQGRVWANLGLRVQWQRIAHYSHVAQNVDFTSASLVLSF